MTRLTIQEHVPACASQVSPAAHAASDPHVHLRGFVKLLQVGEFVFPSHVSPPPHLHTPSAESHSSFRMAQVTVAQGSAGPGSAVVGPPLFPLLFPIVAIHLCITLKDIKSL